jgi:hypothetical protein
VAVRWTDLCADRGGDALLSAQTLKKSTPELISTDLRRLGGRRHGRRGNLSAEVSGRSDGSATMAASPPGVARRVGDESPNAAHGLKFRPPWPLINFSSLNVSIFLLYAKFKR